LPQTINVIEVWQKLQLHGFCENILVSIFEVTRMKDFDTPKKLVMKKNLLYFAMYSWRINPLNQGLKFKWDKSHFIICPSSLGIFFFFNFQLVDNTFIFFG
jgi:hypothetical protein